MSSEQRKTGVVGMEAQVSQDAGCFHGVRC